MLKKKWILLLLCLPLMVFAQVEKRWSAHLDAGGFIASDSFYRSVYGDFILTPKLSLHYLLGGDISLWTSFAMINQDGVGPLSGVSAHSRLSYLTLGLGYSRRLTPDFKLDLVAGPCWIHHLERTPKQESDGNNLGVEGMLRLAWFLKPWCSIDASLGVVWGSDELEGESIKLGGFWTGVGLGVYF